MLITSPCVVSLVWRLEDAQGQLIDELAEPVEFFFGGDDLLAKIEEVLTDQEAGFSEQIHLEPEHAFGDYIAEWVCFEDRHLFPEGLEVGMQMEGLPEGSKTPGMPPDRVYTVTEIYPEHVVLDGNHPLAGVALSLNLTVRDVRPATHREIDLASVAPPDVSVLSPGSPGPHLH